MGDKRREGYIKLGALYGVPWPNNGIPRPGPAHGPVFVSHEESLRRDLEIINARTAAELGPLPSGGLPVQVKCQIDAQGQPKLEQADLEAMEDEAMKLLQVVPTVVLGVAGTLAGCDVNTTVQEGDATKQIAEPQVSVGATKSTVAPEVVEQDLFANELRKSYAECLDTAGGTTWAMQDCIEEEWSYQDSRLNIIYKKLKMLLPEPQWLHLRDEQRVWLSSLWSDETCKWDAKAEGQAQRIAANDCTLRKLARRVNELERMLNGLKRTKDAE